MSAQARKRRDGNQLPLLRHGAARVKLAMLLGQSQRLCRRGAQRKPRVAQQAELARPICSAGFWARAGRSRGRAKRLDGTPTSFLPGGNRVRARGRFVFFWRNAGRQTGCASSERLTYGGRQLGGADPLTRTRLCRRR